MKAMSRIRTWWLLLALIALLLGGLVLAAGETMPRSLVASGGGLLRGPGDTGLRSVTGQPVAGAVQNEFTLCSGYLCGADSPPPASMDSNKLYLPLTTR